ncbi:uncharacterized protein YaaW (UPF0174 family) [Rhodanobacter sp. K2T2]|uniref:DUF3944 domain-containing protein n=1 Tax=Rhodanobacter sp. K2T2 TaxID=2723085 RepID=UPI0015CEDBAD|nr:DUF3944 domain-containing protein [Rhodanobacter sp. K2T2]NYE28534.1 uncharacterized protein YaaW (UPF0174 family) [Rhodanobacter sp. K2T2]
MTLNYRPDPDLDFLGLVTEEQIRGLAGYLTHDKDGQARHTGEILNNEAFKKLHGDPEQYKKNWKLIAAELQYFGGDSAVNAVRRSGVLYREIVGDVAGKMSVKFTKEHSAADIERDILAKVFGDSWEKMDPSQQDELRKEVGIDATLAPAAALSALQIAIRAGGFASYKMATILAQTIAKLIIGRGLSFAATGTLMRTISMFAGPVGWAFTAATTVPAFTGAAYRVTIPAVIHVAYLRLEHSHQDRF